MQNKINILITICTVILATVTTSALADDVAWIDGDEGWLDNGTMKLGIDQDYGGAVTYVSHSESSTNLVNIGDLGREIQQSYYAGLTLDRTSVGQSSAWSPWPWNPVQAGNFDGDQSIINAFWVINSGTTLYIKCQPRLWDMNQELAKCTMHQWLRFETGFNNVVRVDNRIECWRDSDDPWGTAISKHQECPAAYLIRDMAKVAFYNGSSPWTNDTITTITDPGGPPWLVRQCTENWAACVYPSNNFGVGIYSEYDNSHWNIGSYGSGGGGSTSSNTMHIAAINSVSLGRTTTWTYRYWIILGDVSTIRSRAYSIHNGSFPGPPTPPSPPETFEVENGSFETPDVSGWAARPSGSGWSAENNGFKIADSGSAYGNTAYSGSQNAILQGAVTASQSIGGFESGEYYRVDWAEADRSSPYGENDLRVLIDGVVIGYNHYAPSTSWTEKTSSVFKATSSSHTLKFHGINTGGGDHSVFIDSVSIYQVDEPDPDIEWTFDSSTQSWGNTNHISNFGWQSGGYMGGNITGLDPYILSADNLGVTITDVRNIRVRMKNSSNATTAQIYYITNSDQSWSETKHKDFTIVANDSQYREYKIDMSGPYWNGTLKRLRLDPTRLVSSGSFSVDYINISEIY